MSDEKEKKSWRDLDRDRNKSAHVGGHDRGRKKSSAEQNASAKYKKDLDQLFQGSGQVPERFKGVMEKLKESETPEETEYREAVDVLRKAENFREFASAAQLFVRAGHDLPNDEEILIRLLDHPNEGIVQKTLSRYVEILQKRPLVRPEPLKNRLKTIKMMAEEPRTRELADQIEGLL